MPVFGLAFFGPAVLARAQQAFASGEPGANVSYNPFRFDGPMVTANRLKASQDDARQRDNVGNPDEVVLLTEWHYTVSAHR